ncbi:small integral membrane protein 12 isoform X3 [Pongo pygmaeus]|uniref:small integral membrane protein 12 isoform X3 n=1 Tax=Pongo pygmaeus TaxID=9600 RepID=UPI00300DB637
MELAIRVIQFVCFYITLVLPYFISGGPEAIPLRYPPHPAPPRPPGLYSGFSQKIFKFCGIQNVMWPVFWTVVRTYAPYVTFPVAFVVGAVGYHLEWFIRGKDPQPVEEEKSISERREDRKLDELLGKDHTQVVSLKDKLEFAPKAVLNRNRPEKN